METIMTEHTNPELWKGLPKVEITATHIDRALKAMKDDSRNLSAFTTRGSIESAILAGGVIAYLEGLSHRTMSPHKLYGLAEDLDGIFGMTLRSWAIETYGLIDPEREEHRLGNLGAATGNQAEHWPVSLGTHLPNVNVTREHVDRALRAMTGTNGDPLATGTDSFSSPDFVLHAAAIIAVVEGFHKQFEGSGQAQFSLVQEAMGADYLRDNACLQGCCVGTACSKDPFEAAVGERLAAVEAHVSVRSAA
jgi:hypothetical protein